MEINGSLWASPPMQTALANDEVGTVIRLARRAADLNQTQLGDLCGYSVSTISRIERGQPPSQDIHVRRRIAAALHIPAQYLGLAGTDGQDSAVPTGVSTQPVRVDSHPTGAGGVRVGATTDGRGDPVRRREMLSGMAATATAAVWPWQREPGPSAARASLADLLTPSTIEAPPQDLRTLADRLRAARRAFAASHYDDLAGQLRALIAAATAIHRQREGHERDRATIMLAASYRLASELCVKRNDDALGWVFADRALTTARDSGQPMPIAHASRCVAIAMRRAGHHDDAVRLLSTSAAQLHLGANPTDAALASYGSLLCTAAYSNAQAGKRDDANTLLAEATDAAARLSAPVSAGEIIFSPTNVTVYKIGICTALGDSAAAIGHAGTVDVRRLGTPERYARYCIDTARAWEQHGRPDRATQALCAAETQAPEELRRPSCHELITRLMYAPTATPSGLRSLAVRAGAIH
jgi:DNA-binding XRE family transcriptional regulator